MNPSRISRPCRLFALVFVLQTLSISNRRGPSNRSTPSGNKRKKSSFKVCRTWQVQKTPHLLVLASNSRVMTTAILEKLTMRAHTILNLRRAIYQYACHPRGNPRSSSNSSSGGKKRRRRRHHPSTSSTMSKVTSKSR
jgi:hypothetical protein